MNKRFSEAMRFVLRIVTLVYLLLSMAVIGGAAIVMLATARVTLGHALRGLGKEKECISAFAEILATAAVALPLMRMFKRWKWGPIKIYARLKAKAATTTENAEGDRSRFES